MEQDESLSLRNHLWNWLLTPFFILFLFSTSVGYVYSIKSANKPYDLALLEKAEFLAAHLRGERGRIHSGLSRLDEQALIASEGDKVYFEVHGPGGRRLAGNYDLPEPSPVHLKDNQPLFVDWTLAEEKLRILSWRYAPDLEHPETKVLIQVAETTAKRQALVRDILANIVIPQIMMMFMAIVAVWYGVKRGLSPLARIERQVSARARQDLSPLKEIEAPLEVRPLISAFNELFARLRQVLESQKRFIANAAHQLRTPFAGIKSQAELALREKDPEPMRHALEQVLLAADRGVHLVNQLLALARAEPGGRQYENFQRLDLNTVVRDTTLLWVSEALRKNIDLGFEGTDDAIWVMGDAKNLAEMINNLLDNAIRYTPEGGRITASVQRYWSAGRFCIEDTGPGIPPEHRDKVFERFYRAMNTGVEGTGLGLAIVREVAEAHEARIDVEDGSDGQGTRICVRFPVLREEGQ